MLLELKRKIVNRNVVFVSGNFNIVHPGHLRLLRFASGCGDFLIVGINNDSSHGVMLPEDLRMDGIKVIDFVDHAFILTTSVEEFILEIKPSIIVKGNEYKDIFNIEQRALNSYNGKILFDSGDNVFSSIDLLREDVSKFSIKNSPIFPFDYMKRHAIKSDKLKGIIKKISSLRVCVIGDLIVDEYITCEALGMSQEDPTIVVTPLNTTRFIGGAAIVASHAAGLGAQVDFISIVGNDEAHTFSKNELNGFGVSNFFVVDKNRPTTVKQRFRSQGKTLLRVSHLHQSIIDLVFQNKILEKLKSIINKVDLIVFSDFNYGCLPQNLVDEISTLAKDNNVIMAADSQSSSQIGDISRFKNMNLITPTEREARISLRNSQDGLVVLAETLQKKALADNVILKIGEEGILIHTNNDNKKSEWLTDRIGALNPTPKDVAGAGDSLLISSALTMAIGGSIWDASLIGSLSAAIQVSRMGNIPLKVEELISGLG
jgi:rfaE bifunctional protein kinase chain/domain